MTRGDYVEGTSAAAVGILCLLCVVYRISQLANSNRATFSMVVRKFVKNHSPSSR
jgi:hypothetical protein